MATRNELGGLSIKLAIEISIIKFWIHLQSLPENNIAKQCLQLSKEMADTKQSGLMQKIEQLCIKYNSSSITLNENNEKLFTSHIKVAEHSFRARNSARAQGFQKTNMPSIERSFYFLNTRTHCVIFLYDWTQCIDGFGLLLQRYVRKGNDAKNPANFDFCLLQKEPS